MFHSEISELKTVAFPAPTGIRVMMMPFHLHDENSLPKNLAGYRRLVGDFCSPSHYIDPVAYLTIDEALVKSGETHRRPGLHVDGVGPDGRAGAWGGGGGGWAKQGMVVAASVTGSRAWRQPFFGTPGLNGDCEHLRAQLHESNKVDLLGGVAYLCSPLAVHESLPMARDTLRQFVRISLPNDCPWYEGYTENPLGIKPTGPIHPARSAFMAFRPEVGSP